MKSSLSFPRVLVGVLTTSVLLAGCKQVTEQVQQGAQQAVSQVAGNLLQESDLMGINDPLVRKNLVAQANARAYRMVSTSSGRGQGTTTTEIQIDGTKVRFHTLMEENGKPTSDMIVIDNTTYIKDFSDGKWWKQVASETKASPTTESTAPPTLDELKTEVTKKQQVATFKQLGTEACGNLTCYKYQEVDSDNKEASRTFWFDNQKFLTRKEEQKFGEFTSTNSYTYENVNISAPSPTKDVPAGKSIYEMLIPNVGTIPSGGTGEGAKPPTQEELNKLMQQYGGGQQQP